MLLPHPDVCFTKRERSKVTLAQTRFNRARITGCFKHPKQRVEKVNANDSFTVSAPLRCEDNTASSANTPWRSAQPLSCTKTYAPCAETRD